MCVGGGVPIPSTIHTGGYIIYASTLSMVRGHSTLTRGLAPSGSLSAWGTRCVQSLPSLYGPQLWAPPPQSLLEGRKEEERYVKVSEV
jgi:hypothetical protein